MSRRAQDIPIRPRYGYTDEEGSANTAQQQEGEQKATGSENNRGRRTGSSTPASSYTEIPFLAQYPGPVPPSDVTPTAQNSLPGSNENYMNLDSGEEYDEDDENSNSKDSSGEPHKASGRPKSLQCDSTFPYELEGSTSNTGEMRHFVANNLEATLREGSPQRAVDFGLTSEHSTPSTSTAPSTMTRRFLQSQAQNVPEVDGEVLLSDIELETQYLATAVDNLIENLSNLLHSISSITADNVEVHKNAVIKLTDTLDANIKCMYTIMAKTEEISKSMRPTEQLGQRIREIKRLVDMMDSTM